MMKIIDGLNYCVLANDINRVFLANFASLPIIDSNISYQDLVEKLEFFSSKQVVFNNTWYNLRNEEKKEVIKLLDKQNIKYINITSNIEDALYADYIVVYDKKDIVLEGPKEGVLKEEKLLKRMGYGIPFVVDLSTQLNYYDIFNKIYYDMDSLVGELWN